jgi:hypothetical protein
MAPVGEIDRAMMLWLEQLDEVLTVSITVFLIWRMTAVRQIAGMREAGLSIATRNGELDEM